MSVVPQKCGPGRYVVGRFRIEKLNRVAGASWTTANAISQHLEARSHGVRRTIRISARGESTATRIGPARRRTRIDSVES
jgi:hypothetical protein